MDRLEAMATFVAVAELGSFAAAAKRMKLSRPAVTRLVAGLEAHLSIRLLQRTTRSVTLTDAGARYLESTRRILAHVGEAEREARAQHSEPSGRFVIAAPNVFGRREVAPLVSDFLARYPAVRGELQLSDRLVNLVEEGVDVAVRIGFLEDSTLRARSIGATRRVVVASPKYLAQRKRIRVPSDLASHATIHFTSLAPQPEWRFGDQRVAISPLFTTNSADAAITHAERGAGLTMVLGYQVAGALRSGKLEIVLAKYEPPPFPIQIVYPSGRLVSATVRAFIELAIARARWNFVDLL